ncbi:MAG: o-succinylbenzoate synthase [Cyclobacteriaceae bacterium]|nr:o-succinylbenzoate synthase [Cyclobacteriaceae bacterium HetDA_MAG_MS6]
MLKLEFTPSTLKFKFDAGTSRGVMKTRDVWYIKLLHKSTPRVYGIGEVSPLGGLSTEEMTMVPEVLGRLQQMAPSLSLPDNEKDILLQAAELVPSEFPSIRFGLEMAMLDLYRGGRRLLFENDFSRGKPIAINGLIWMGEEDFVLQQIKDKINQGFDCIKMKIGALDFETELRILAQTREALPSGVLRVDANGAFRTDEALKKLKQLEEFDLHSIEQPILPRQPEAMQLLCKKSSVKIALDEELIGVVDKCEKKSLLETIKPPYLVLKPSLLGGFAATKEWIELADEMGIEWWITSALESNIGLNAICQFASTLDVKTHQGLGTGSLFHNNIASPLRVTQGQISVDPNGAWDEVSF